MLDSVLDCIVDIPWWVAWRASSIIGRSDGNFLESLKICWLSNQLNCPLKLIFKDSKKLKILKKLGETTSILKPDKGSGVVIIDTLDYYNSLMSIFSDTTKFRKLDTDTLQAYLCKLLNRNELTDDIFENIRPQNTRIACAHGLLKVHKKFDHIPLFRPIIDMTGSMHYSVGKYITG